MRNRFFLAPVAIVACLGLSIAATHADGTTRPAFGKQNPFRTEELPEGQLKTRLQSLDLQAKEKAMKWLHSFDFDGHDAAEHLRVDHGGGIFIICPDVKDESGGGLHDAAQPAEPRDNSHERSGIAPLPQDSNSLPAVEFAAVSVSSPPAYHSRPGAARHIYLDFNGGTVSGTAWNTSAGVTTWNVKVWSQDSDITTYSDAEQAWMKRVWQRVAEDYAPFDVDVTTDAAFDPDNYSGNKDNVGWVLICDTTDKNGVALPHAGSGGVAYIGVFGSSTYSPTYQPAWVTSTNGGGDESVIAEAVSHEMGHNMGLSHDGTSTLAYYGGHGSGDVSWGPLMGTGYFRNVSQWSKGEYFDANQIQDDLAIIAGRIPYRTDDHGGTVGTATPLTVTSGNTIISTTPENDPTNASPVNKGVIERNSDVDVFSFYTGTGNVQLNANPWIQPAGMRGGNLDILLELYNQTGTMVATNNSASLTSAAISATLTQGYYYLYVRNTGTGTPAASSPSGYTAYGSIGQYFISGTIASATPPPVLTSITPTSGFAETVTALDVSGNGISTSTSFKLTRSGQSDIPAFSVTAVGSVLRCQFNLAGAATGAWNLVATNPSLETSTLSAAFTVVGAIWTESFDGAVSGWSTEATIGSNSWSLSTAQSKSPGTSYFAAGPSSKSTTNLISPGVAIPAGASSLQLRFWHSYVFQNARDAGKLEFSINNGAWFDVTSSGSGAAFASNGYTTSISSTGPSSNRNEFAGQLAWSGNSGGFVETVVNLTDNAKYTGKNLRIRWRIATDASTSSSGWYVDSISLIGGGDLVNQQPVIAAAATSNSAETQTDSDSTIYQIIRSTSAALSVSASDDGGEPALTYTWSVATGPGAQVIFSSNGTNASKITSVSFQAAGDYRISVSIRDAKSLAVTSSVNLRVVQTGSTLAVAPSVASLAVGVTQVFSATLLDQFNTTMVSQPLSFIWTPGAGGTIDAAGLFTATNAGGPFIVSATSGAISGTASVSVTPASASVTLGSLSQTYDASEKTVTTTTSPPGLAVSVTYNGSGSPPVNAGSYPIVATITDPNYQGTSSGTLVIDKAAATIALGGLLQTYDGSPKSVSATTTPAGLSLGISYDGAPTPPVNAGSYPVVASVTSPNYQGTSSGTLVIDKATATITLGGLLQTYDGSPKSVAATTTPGGLPLDISYDGSPTPPVNAGSHPLVASVTSPNYQGTTSGTLVIDKAAATIALGGLLQTYDGSPKSATATTIPADLSVQINCDGSPNFPTAAGTYLISAGVDDVNYSANVSGSLVIEKAPASIVFDGLSQAYNGLAKTVTVSTVPENLATAITYDGSPTAPTAIGTYAITALITDPNHTGDASGSLLITPGNDWSSWQHLQFTQAEKSAGLAEDNADPDADGLPNLAEYALGADPHAFTPPFTASLDETTLSFTFTRPADLPGITYAAEFSDATTTWFPATLEILTTGPIETLKASVPIAPADPSRRFLRLHLERE